MRILLNRKTGTIIQSYFIDTDCSIPWTSVIDHELISMVVILLLPLIQEGMLSVTSESMCTKYWFTLVKLAQEKVWLGELTI